MSRPRQCWDNAVAESRFASLKEELIYRRSWPTRAQARAAIFDYIEVLLQPPAPPLDARLPQPRRLRSPAPHRRPGGIVNLSGEPGQAQATKGRRRTWSRRLPGIRSVGNLSALRCERRSLAASQLAGQKVTQVKPDLRVRASVRSACLV